MVRRYTATTLNVEELIHRNVTSTLLGRDGWFFSDTSRIPPGAYECDVSISTKLTQERAGCPLFCMSSTHLCHDGCIGVDFCPSTIVA